MRRVNLPNHIQLRESSRTADAIFIDFTWFEIGNDILSCRPILVRLDSILQYRKDLTVFFHHQHLSELETTYQNLLLEKLLTASHSSTLSKSQT